MIFPVKKLKILINLSLPIIAIYFPLWLTFKQIGVVLHCYLVINIIKK